MKKIAVACAALVFCLIAADVFAQDLTFWYGRQSRHSSWGIGLSVPSYSYSYGCSPGYYYAPPPVYSQTTCYPTGSVVTYTPTGTYVAPTYQCTTQTYYPSYSNSYYYYRYWP